MPIASMEASEVPIPTHDRMPGTTTLRPPCHPLPPMLTLPTLPTLPPCPAFIRRASIGVRRVGVRGAPREAEAPGRGGSDQGPRPLHQAGGIDSFNK